MSFEQRLRHSSYAGLNLGLSLTEKQQILRMQQMKQKSRRVSLNSIISYSPSSDSSVKSGLNEDESQQQTQEKRHSQQTQHSRHSQQSLESVETLVNQSTAESTLVSNNQTNSLLNQNVNSVQNRVNQSVNNSGVNSGLNSGLNSSALPVVTTTATTGSVTSIAMLPIISYDSIVSSRPNADMSRVNRRMSKSTAESFTCSQQSILSAMDRFVKSVNNMDSTVLIPSKLRDIDIPSLKLQRIPPALANTDLHSFYLMLNDVRKELLWGPGTASAAAANLMPMSGRSSPRELKHIRQPSDDSLGSMGSTASSSSDQDTDSEADSMITDRDSIDEHTSHLAAAFRHHLQGLHTILHQLADSADYLSSRYQEEVDASSL